MFNLLLQVISSAILVTNKIHTANTIQIHKTQEEKEGKTVRATEKKKIDIRLRLKKTHSYSKTTKTKST